MYPLSKKSLFIFVIFLQVFFMFDYFNSLYVHSFLLVVKGIVVLKLFRDTFQISFESIFGEYNPKKIIETSSILLIIGIFLSYIFSILKIETNSNVFVFNLMTITFFIAYSFSFTTTNVVLLNLLKGDEYNLSFSVSTVIIIMLNILPNLLNFDIGTILNILIQTAIIFILNKMYLKSNSLINYFCILLTYNLLFLLLQNIFY